MGTEPTARKPKSTKDDGDDSGATTGRLFGWAGIEKHVMKHDTHMMKDYVDDIDTLLVFAALFSSILTTFLVQTYPSLQPSDSAITNQLLAYQVFSQRNNTALPPTVDATVSFILATSPLVPSLSARWTNILFFFSLILGLASALLGIMAKQWIREYMRWNAPLATPRQNVLVRQIRFENWEKWNADAFIWSIPSLLQLAMILFLAGIITLLWTLDNIVAVAVTVLISAFLLVISVLTILPILVRRCPFRSPTAWVVSRLWDFAWHYSYCGYAWLHQVWLQHIYRLWRRRVPPVYNRIVLPAYHDWRAFDVDPGIGSDIQKSVCLELAREATHLQHDGTFSQRPFSGSPYHSTTRYALHDLAETPVLLRVLQWVGSASQDEHVTLCVDQCMSTLHPEPSPSMSNQTDLPNARALTAWSIIASLEYTANSFLRGVPNKFVFATNAPSPAHALTITRLRASLGLAVCWEASNDDTRRFTCTLSPGFAIGTRSSDVKRPVLKFNGLAFRFLAAELDRTTTEADWMADHIHIRRIFELTAAMYHMLSVIPRPTARHPDIFETNASLKGLRAILNVEPEAITHKLYLDERTPGLRSLAFWLASRHARLSVSDSGAIGVSVGLTGVAVLETLLQCWTAALDFQRCLPDELNMVFIAGLQWLVQTSNQFALPSLFFTHLEMKADILAAIWRALDIALKRETQGYRLLSFYRDLDPWMTRLPHHYTNGLPDVVRPICGLLHTIQKGLRDGAFQNIEGAWAIKVSLHFRLIQVHKQHDCGDIACPWKDHRCRKTPDSCPLLQQNPDHVHGTS